MNGLRLSPRECREQAARRREAARVLDGLVVAPGTLQGMSGEAAVLLARSLRRAATELYEGAEQWDTLAERKVRPLRHPHGFTPGGVA